MRERDAITTDGASPALGPATPVVLLVEDDRGLRESLATVLEFQGLKIVQAESAEQGDELLAEHNPDVVVLDVNLPGQNGLDYLSEVRARGDQRQVLLLTARKEVADRVAGLDAGADDYLPKPFALEELLARVRTLVRRAEAAGSASPPPASAGGPVPAPTDATGTKRPTSAPHPSTNHLEVGPVSVDVGARRATRTVGSEAVVIDLTKMEYDLLELLLRNRDLVLSRSTIHEEIWGYDEEYGSNTLEVLVSSLRRKLEADETERIIQTVRGVGYVARLPTPRSVK